MSSIGYDQPAPGDPDAPGAPGAPAPGTRRRSGLAGRIGAAADRIDAATPPGRERAVDGLRAYAICGVVFGHWLVTATVLGGDGAVRLSSPLRDLPEFAAVSWPLQSLALFFLVGGYVGAHGLARSRMRGESDRQWIAARLLRLGRPVLAVTAVWGTAAPLLLVAGVPEASLRSALLLVAQPLWFIGMYAVVTALTPCAMALERRWGLWAALSLAAIVAVVDLARFGPWGDAVPDWIGFTNLVPAWLFGSMLGISWRHGRLTRPVAWVLLLSGAGLLLLLVARMGYPASAVGVPGAVRSNSNPPSLFVPALGAAQIGAAMLAIGPLERLLRRPMAWAGVAWLNLNAMTVFCWHLTALSAPVLAVSAIGGAATGLNSDPDGLVWAAARLSWMPLLAAVLAALCTVFQRFEGPWSGCAATVPVRASAVIGTALFAGIAALLI